MKAAVSHIEYFLNQGLNVYLVSIGGKDPNEIGYLEMVKCVNNAKQIDFFELLNLKMGLTQKKSFDVDFLEKNL